MPSVKTLSEKDMKSNRLLFQLVPQERPIEETGYGLLPTVQTQDLKRCNKKGRTEFLPLHLLPTPTAAEATKYTTICRGDDGLPFDVDDLAISEGKWRKESIKAYGNAWVPQVALEIFKAIEEYNNN